MTQVKTQANWKITKNFPEQGLRVRVSEKGAIQIQQIAPSGEAYQLVCLPLKAMEAFLNVAGDIGNLFHEEEFKALVADIPRAKEMAKVHKQVLKETEKAALVIQSKVEELKRLGIDPTEFLKKFSA